jgi:hypothetical protein
MMKPEQLRVEVATLTQDSAMDSSVNLVDAQLGVGIFWIERLMSWSTGLSPTGLARR